jgi:hypothetical protein
VNTPESYERRTESTIANAEPPSAVQEVAALAVHKDPSLPPAGQPASPEADRSQRASIAWVRATDLLTSVGAARLRQAADAQVDVVRRSRRAPLTVASRLRGRVSRSSIARPQPAVPTPNSPANGIDL